MTTTIPWLLLYWFLLWIGGAWVAVSYWGWPQWVLIISPFMALGFSLIWVFYKLKEQQAKDAIQQQAQKTDQETSIE